MNNEPKLELNVSLEREEKESTEGMLYCTKCKKYQSEIIRMFSGTIFEKWEFNKTDKEYDFQDTDDVEPDETTLINICTECGTELTERG
jgi:hypothetical protein